MATGIIVITRGVNATVRSLINFNKETIILAKITFNKALILLRKEIRNETPRKSGDLRRSVKILKNVKRRSGFEGIVGPDGSAVNVKGVSYAPFVVFGTRRNKANNFIARGVKNARGGIKILFKNMRSGMKAIMRKVKSKG